EALVGTGRLEPATSAAGPPRAAARAVDRRERSTHAPYGRSSGPARYLPRVRSCVGRVRGSLLVVHRSWSQAWLRTPAVGKGDPTRDRSRFGFYTAERVCPDSSTSLSRVLDLRFWATLFEMRVGIFVVSASLAGAGVALAQSDWAVDPWSPAFATPRASSGRRSAPALRSRTQAPVEWIDERSPELADPWQSSTIARSRAS